MISVEHKGSFKNMDAFIKRMSQLDILQILEQHALEGVSALASATPKESGLTSSLWGYEVSATDSSYSITWTNAHLVQGVPVVILLQYGHATGTGGYVLGQNFINPAMQPIFDRIEQDVWKAVTSA